MQIPSFHFVRMEHALAQKPEENFKKVMEQPLVLVPQLYISVKKMVAVWNANTTLNALG